VAPQLRIVTIDTLRLPQETYDLMAELEAKYGIQIERYKPDPQRLQKMIENHGEYLFFDSREKQSYCCAVRKVEPNQRALETVDIWISGLRRDQSNSRMTVPRVSEIHQNGRAILKLCPLIDWPEQQVNDYIHNHITPYNKLYDNGYKSIGCVICSTPTRPSEDARAGRWRWWNHLRDGDHKECGIHTGGSGI
jgi:phosphoadenylyl-sulfate reductase (thioredoxin)